MEQLFFLLTLAFFAGLMIGCVGIGGVILVPIMTWGAGIPTGTAIAAAMMGYIVTGLSGASVFLRNRSIDRSAMLALCLGGAPGALAGAFAVQIIDARVTQGLIAVLALASGLHNLRGSAREAGQRTRSLHRTALASIGVLVGLVSAITGTGGPVVLVPLLLAFRLPVLTAVGLGQMIQIPVACLATLGALAIGVLDLRLGAILGAGLALGSVLGAHLAHRLNQGVLRRLAASILLTTGLFVAARILVAAPT